MYDRVQEGRIDSTARATSRTRDPQNNQHPAASADVRDTRTRRTAGGPDSDGSSCRAAAAEAEDQDREGDQLGLRRPGHDRGSRGRLLHGQSHPDARLGTAGNDRDKQGCGSGNRHINSMNVRPRLVSGRAFLFLVC